jgi:hypothetical protein
VGGSAHVGTWEKVKLWSLLAPMCKLVALHKNAIDGKIIMFIVTEKTSASIMYMTQGYREGH